MSAISESIGPYKLLRLIGRGGTSVVYEASRPGETRRLALKILKRELCRDEAVKRRFQREARLLKEIAHPGIVEVLDEGEEDGQYYLVLPLVENPTLGETLNQTGSIQVPGPHAGLIHVLVSVLMALDAIHQRGVIHRDLTPGNIFVESGNRGLLVDFGIVKILGSESILTRTGALLGTVPYMSPEQLSGDPVTHFSDIYQVGFVLYRMVAGRLPFDSTLSDAVRVKCLLPSIPPPAEFGAQIPEGLSRVIETALTKNPSERFRSAIDMAVRLKRECE